MNLNFCKKLICYKNKTLARLSYYDSFNLQKMILYTKELVNLKSIYVKDYIDECNTYSYTEDGQPEDAHDHCINSCQYAWLPYKSRIGDMDAIKQIIKDAYD